MQFVIGVDVGELRVEAEIVEESEGVVTEVAAPTGD